MPSPNTIKYDYDNTYHHIYNRGVNKQIIFQDDNDFVFFLGLLKRYLSNNVAKDNQGHQYPHFAKRMTLLCYCLMPNHFHLFIHQKEKGTMAQFMQATLISYSSYFNSKYKRTGTLFEGRYRASCLGDESYFIYISKYIHLNPGNWPSYPYSSIAYYLGHKQAEWIDPTQITKMFSSPNQYLQFLADNSRQAAD